MASKSKTNGINGMHTAGIFSDMTVDGPEIGTLVVIVDRAKNLPNRKTIGKQDPYCAARLGKEAKKTETDRRGGQTPRWDQELRYTVHDSPDYYQLKVSVFNDDKKTDLIGETWVNLKEVVVPGGGQNDLWHNLSCKGKYAGEIRIEITYYDTRPKEEKPEKVKQTAVSGGEDGGRDSLRGPRGPKASPVKRRPLPSDPVTGVPAPVPLPDHVQTPPRGYQPSTVVPDHGQTPPRGYQQPTAVPEQYQTPPRGYQQPSAIPEHVHTPQRGHPSSNHIPNQSPLQSVEYSTPPHRFSHSQGYDSSNHNGYEPPPDMVAATPPAQPIQSDRYEIYDPAPRQDHYRGNSVSRYDEQESIHPRDQYSPRYAPYDSPQPEDLGPPPPPPAHRSRTGSSHVSPAPAMTSQDSYGFHSDQKAIPYDMPSHDAHRHSVPSYSQSHSYQAYSPGREDNQFRKSSNGGYQQSPPRHHSYDSRYGGNQASMQPTVEDVPDSPAATPYSSVRGSMSNTPQYDDRRHDENVFPATASYSGHRRTASNASYEDRQYDESASPAPLNLSGCGSAVSVRNSASTTPNHQYSNSSIGYTSSNSQLSYRDRSHSHTDASVSSRTSYNSMPQPDQRSRGFSEDQSAGYGMPPVPATLVAGMDPMIAQEISERIYDEKRATYNPAGNSARGRYRAPQYQPPQPTQQSYDEGTMVPYSPASASTATNDDSQTRYSTAMVPVARPRAISPDHRSMSHRKSVSPAPPPSGRQGMVRKSVSPAPPPLEDRRLSGVPFGPDSYNALNPTVSGSVSTHSLSAVYNTKDDPDAKIITHDGREIDPSDHIPESNYAPLLESKAPKYASQLPDRNYRPPPSQPNPATGRRPLKVAGRPQSMAAIQFHSGQPEPVTPMTGRNRLQKKANRMSAQPAQGSSPLAPITPCQDNSYTPRSLPRASTGDFSTNENYAPYASSPGYRGTAGAPPIPAKVPMNNGPPPTQPTGGDAWALLEEMKNIDLGQGRARRRGY